MTSPNRISMAKAIGGKWLLYIPPYAWLLPLWFSGSLLSTRNISNWNEFLLVGAINILSLTACASLFLLFRTTLWKRSALAPQKFTPVSLVVLGGVLLGALKAVVTVYLTFLWLNTDAHDLGGRILASSSLGIIVMIVVPVTMSQLELYRAQRQELIANIVQRELSLSPQKVQSNQDLLNEFVSTSIATLEQAKQNPQSLPAILDHIRLNQVRPLSHQIWSREQGQIPDFTLVNLLSVSLIELRFSLLPVIIGYTLLMGPSQLSEYGFNAGVTALGIQAILIALILGFTNMIPSSGMVWGLVKFIAANLLTTAAIAISTTALFGPIPHYLPAQATLGALQVLLTLTLFTSVFSLTRKTHRAVEQDLLKLSPNLGINEVKRAQQARADRELAQLLHSQVQNLLLAKSVEITQLLDSHRSLESEEHVLEEHLSELESYLEGLTLPTQPSGHGSIENVLAAWSPVLDISVESSQSVAESLSASEAELVASILNEGIANALRHGLARAVQIHLNIDQKHILVVIDDDGVGPRHGVAGLGTYLFLSIPESTWELENSDALSGARLCVEFARQN